MSTTTTQGCEHCNGNVGINGCDWCGLGRPGTQRTEAQRRTMTVLRTVMQDLGIEYRGDVTFHNTGSTKMGTFQLSVDRMGPAAPLFVSMEVTVYYGADSKGNIYFKYDYNWQHDRGSNGYVVTKSVPVLAE